MRITVLTDNTASGPCLAEHGFSLLVEHDMPVLFDTGQSDVFVRNAGLMNAGLDNVDIVVLSHGHYDHGGGLAYVREGRTLISHPGVFARRFNKAGGRDIGLDISREEAEERFTFRPSAAPLRISDRLFFLGAVPRENGFEARSTPFRDADGNDDFVPDDSALAAVVDDGLVVISGCAHAGICNTVEYAKQVTGEVRVKAVMGGFHLKRGGNAPETRATVRYLKNERIEHVLPSHCTALPALAAFYNAFRMPQVCAGMSFVF